MPTDPKNRIQDGDYSTNRRDASNDLSLSRSARSLAVEALRPYKEYAGENKRNDRDYYHRPLYLTRFNTNARLFVRLALWSCSTPSRLPLVGGRLVREAGIAARAVEVFLLSTKRGYFFFCAMITHSFI